MEATLGTEKAAKDIANNIAVIASALKNRGYDFNVLDKAAQECRDYVTARVQQIEPKDEVDALNIEALFVMIMMHTELKKTLCMINRLSTEKGVNKEMVVDELVLETMKQAGFYNKENTGKKIKVE